MAIPWLTLIDVAFGVNDLVRRATSGRTQGASRSSALAPNAAASRPRDARLAGVMVSALKEVFDRDTRRHEYEQQRAEEERRRLEDERARVERGLRLELLRQAGERESSRARSVLIASTACLLVSMLVVTQIQAGTGARVTVGCGWLLVLGAMAVSITEQGRLSQLLATGDDRLAPERLTGGATGIALGLLLGGLALVALAVLLS